MKQSAYRILAAALVFLLIQIPLLSCAESGDWVCENCGLTGNTGKFCPECGAERPSAGWTCQNCGLTGNTGKYCSECGAAKPSPGESQQTVNEQLEQIPGETDKVKICLESVNASSYIGNKSDPTRWVPDNAADGDESTCWQFSAKKGLKGKSWLELNVGEGQTVDEIWFKNGFWAYNDKGKDQYSINARLKGVRISFLYRGETEYRDATELTLKDEVFKDWQRFALGSHENVTAVRLAILTTYQGNHYKNDVCLSEVMLVQYSPAAGAKPATEAKTATVYESNPAVTGAGLLMKLSTRSGPGTQYDEPGTFFGNSWQEQNVKVLGKHYDGSTWWVLLDFRNVNKDSYRVWTGLKRVDVDINKVKEYNPSGQGTVSATSNTYRGPGKNYAKAKVTISGWKDVVAYGRENGYVEVEFQQGKNWYRLWVPENETSIDWGNDFSGE